MFEVKGLTKEDRGVLKVPLENATPQSAVTIKDLRIIDKLCGLLESDDEPLVFEDADFAFLKQRVEGYSGWNPLSETRKLILPAIDKVLGVSPKSKELEELAKE